MHSLISIIVKHLLFKAQIQRSCNYQNKYTKQQMLHTVHIQSSHNITMQAYYAQYFVGSSYATLEALEAQQDLSK